MLSRLVITFLPRSKCLLISWLQTPFAVILEPRKLKSATVYTVSPSICHKVMGLDAMIFLFSLLNFKLAFSLSSLTFIKRLFSSPSLSAIRVPAPTGLQIHPPLKPLHYIVLTCFPSKTVSSEGAGSIWDSLVLLPCMETGTEWVIAPPQHIHRHLCCSHQPGQERVKQLPWPWRGR